MADISAMLFFLKFLGEYKISWMKMGESCMKRVVKVAVVALMVVSLVAQGSTVADAKGKAKGKAGKPMISKKNITMSVGDSKKLSVKHGKKVKWSSSNNSVASVGKAGKVVAKNAGSATITAKTGSKSLTCKVTVKVPTVKKIELEDDELDLDIGEEYALEATVSPKKAIKGVKLTWSSDDEEVCKVDQDGNLTAIAEGFATITVKVGNKKAICEVEVSDPDAEDEDDFDTDESEDEADGTTEEAEE